MKLFNAIAVFDVYVVAESSEDARAALMTALTEGQAPSEIVGVEVMREDAIRVSWRDERPFVGAAVPDDGFAQIQGKSTVEIFRHLYTKSVK